MRKMKKKKNNLTLKGGATISISKHRKGEQKFKSAPLSLVGFDVNGTYRQIIVIQKDKVKRAKKAMKYYQGKHW